MQRTRSIPAARCSHGAAAGRPRNSNLTAAKQQVRGKHSNSFRTAFKQRASSIQASFQCCTMRRARGVPAP
eukprot:5668964-Lingulodinium_polyedra.AAC.1